jgi:exopolysaccharide production protein ExoQ
LIITKFVGVMPLNRSARAVIPSVFIDWALCFVSFTALLLIQWAIQNIEGGSGSAIAILLFVVPWAWIFVRNFGAVIVNLVSNWPLLLLPFYAILSTAWSAYPGFTLKAGIEFLVTVIIGILAGTCIKPRVVLWAFFAAGTVVTIVGVLMGVSEVRGDEITLAGLFGSKNYFGLCVSLLLLAATVIAFDKSQPSAGRLVALAVMAMLPFFLVLSRSTGALICCLAALGLMGIWAFSFRLSSQVRFAILFLVVPFATIALLVWQGMGDSDAVLTFLGKDLTLTGRTWIWEWAKIAIAEKPLLGVGYEAYWAPGNWGAEHIWLHDAKSSKTGYHFHNMSLQVTVDLGYTGLVLFWGILAATGVRIGSCFLFSRANPQQIFAIGAFFFLLFRLYIEVDLMWQFQIPTVIFSLIWVYLRSSRYRAELRQYRAAD